MDIVSTYLQDIVTALTAAVLVALFSLLIGFWGRFGEWLRLKHATSHQALLWSIAQEAYAKAEQAGKDLLTSNKLDYAIDYALKKASRLRIPIGNKDELKAKILEAWVKMDKMPQQLSLQAKTPSVDKSTETEPTEALKE